MTNKSQTSINTQRLRADQPGAIQETAEHLKQGRVVAYPTDTLYGVGVNAFSAEAIEQLYDVKERTLDKGIPILLADLEDLEKVAEAIPPLAQSLIEQYWPGALTLIVPKKSTLPANISPNDGIAVRIPAHNISRALIRAAGGAVATSSANKSGRPPARTAAEAFDALNGLVAAVLDGGPVEVGLASTVLDCMSNPPKVLREGPVTVKNLSRKVTETK
jgi:L-threonylcarbamoyladenylate synthase